jgi:hypothetical protein
MNIPSATSPDALLDAQLLIEHNNGLLFDF